MEPPALNHEKALVLLLVRSGGENHNPALYPLPGLFGVAWTDYAGRDIHAHFFSLSSFWFLGIE